MIGLQRLWYTTSYEGRQGRSLAFLMSTLDNDVRAKGVCVCVSGGMKSLHFYMQIVHSERFPEVIIV